MGNVVPITAKEVQVFRFSHTIKVYELSSPVDVWDAYKKKLYPIRHIQVSHAYSGEGELPGSVPKTMVTDFDFEGKQPLKWDSLAGSNADYVPHEQAVEGFLKYANLPLDIPEMGGTV